MSEEGSLCNFNFWVIKRLLAFMGHAVTQLVEAMRYKPEGLGFDSRWCQCPYYGPGVASASNRNEYQEYFWGVKVAGA
jgi:hypothetical protein